jgi:hypothetical protein
MICISTKYNLSVLHSSRDDGIWHNYKIKVYHLKLEYELGKRVRPDTMHY